MSTAQVFILYAECSNFFKPINEIRNDVKYATPTCISFTHDVRLGYVEFDETTTTIWSWVSHM